MPKIINHKKYFSLWLKSFSPWWLSSAALGLWPGSASWQQEQGRIKLLVLVARGKRESGGFEVLTPITEACCHFPFHLTQPYLLNVPPPCSNVPPPAFWRPGFQYLVHRRGHWRSKPHILSPSHQWLMSIS